MHVMTGECEDAEDQNWGLDVVKSEHPQEPGWCQHQEKQHVLNIVFVPVSTTAPAH